MRNHPPSGTFGAVMSLGILSVALDLLGDRSASVALLVLAGLAYLGIAAFYLACGRRLLRLLWNELADARTAFGHFTFPAASNVLATRLALIHVGAASSLLGLGLLAWLTLMVAVPRRLGVGRHPSPKPNGSAFLVVVASQSCAVAISALDGHQPAAWAVAGVLWCAGLLLYAVILVGLVRRHWSTPADTSLDPSYGLVMGALAISTLAAVLLHVTATPGPFAPLGPFLLASAVITWTGGGILMVLVSAGWVLAAVSRGMRPTYQVNEWSVVFPLGMYATAGILLSRATLWPLPRAVAGVSVAASLACLIVVVVLLVLSSPAARRRHG